MNVRKFNTKYFYEWMKFICVMVTLFYCEMRMILNYVDSIDQGLNDESYAKLHAE